MKMNLPTFILLNAVVILLIIGGVLVVGWFLLTTNVDQTEIQYKAELSRLSASALVYKSRIGSYEGLCGDIGVPDKFRCAESTDAYAIEADLSAGLFYCLDSTGFMGKTRISKGMGVACRQ